MKFSYRSTLLILTIIILIISGINPVKLEYWALENILTIIFLAVLIVTRNQIQLSKTAYTLIFLFLALHITGSHYAYSVPLFADLQEAMDLSRNHFDRVVHFAFGLLLTYPLYELIVIKANISKINAAVMAFALINTFSLAYELIEWLVALVVDPEAGSAFLGAQGDEWDAQKDMALALLGSLIALIIPLIKRKLPNS
jgi:putative membrane protein